MSEKKTNTDEVKYAGSTLRSFKWMPRLDFYVLRGFLLPFSVLIFAFTLLFLIAEAYTDKDMLLQDEQEIYITEGDPSADSNSEGEVKKQENAGDTKDVQKTAKPRRMSNWEQFKLKAEYLCMKVPQNVRFIFPLTVLLACMYTLANFGRNKEITAMRASGISLVRFFMPIVCFAFVMTIVDYYFGEVLVPACLNRTRQLKLVLENNTDESSTEVQYNSADNKRNWMFVRFYYLGKTVNVCELPDTMRIAGETQDVKRIVSLDDVLLQLRMELDRINAVMTNPQKLQFLTDEKRGELLARSDYLIKRMAELQTNSYGEVSPLFIYGDGTVRLKLLHENEEFAGESIYRQVQQLNADFVSYDEKQGWILYNCRVSSQSQDGEVASNDIIAYHEKCVLSELFGKGYVISETPIKIHYLSLDPELLSAGELHGILKRNPNLADEIRLKYWTYFYQHLAFPWACFLCVFLALPLAAKNERSGISTAILSAVGIIIIYYVLSQNFIILGTRGVLPPFVAGVVPTLLFAVYGGYQTYKAG